MDIDPEKLKVISAVLEEGQPMAITNLCVDFPCCIMFIAALFYLGMAAIAVRLDYFVFDYQTERDYLVWSDDKVKIWDMREAARQELLRLGSSGNSERVRTVDEWDGMLLYQADGEDLWTKEHLLSIQTIEAGIQELEYWPLLCKAQSPDDRTCSDQAFVSPLSVLDLMGINDLQSTSQEELDLAWERFYNDKALYREHQDLFMRRAAIAATGKIQYMRAFVNFGAPLSDQLEDKSNRYALPKDADEKQERIMTYFAGEVADYIRDQTEPVKSTFYSQPAKNAAIYDLIYFDAAWATLSCILVLFWLVVHLRSLFLGVVAIITILCGFSTAAVIIQGICRVGYYSQLHALLIFIILGNATNSIFVFIDAWRQSERQNEFCGDLYMRLAYTWRRAINTNFAANLATSVAFLANLMSPIMPISAMGIYAAVIIPIQFAGIIIVMPAAAVWNEKWLAPCFRAICNCCDEQQDDGVDVPLDVRRDIDFISPGQQTDDDEEIIEDIEMDDSLDVAQMDDDDEGNDSMEAPRSDRLEGGEKYIISERESNRKHGFDHVNDVEVEDMILDPELRKSLNQLNESGYFAAEPRNAGLAWFFGGLFNRNIYRAKQGIVACSMCWLIVCVLSVMDLRELTTVEGIVPPDHELAKAYDILEYDFEGGEQTSLVVTIFFGVDAIDRNETSYWDPQDIGRPVMNPWLDVSSQDAQMAIKNLCADLRTKEFVRPDGLRCWIEDFEAYLKQENVLNRGLPVDQVDFTQQFPRWLDTDAGYDAQMDNIVGLNGTRLAYFEIRALSVGAPDDPINVIEPIHDSWQQYVEEFARDPSTPLALRSAKQTAGFSWAYIPNHTVFLWSAVQGIAIASGFAFIIILMTTGNPILAAMALYCMGLNVMSLFTIIVYKQWEMGRGESVAIVIIIGLSVDHVVNLAMAYRHSKKDHMSLRTKQAYAEAGVSILSGSVAMLSSGIVLFGARIVAFRKFAVILTSVSVLAFASSMLVFGSLLHLAGPEDGCCDVDCWEQIYYCICKRPFVKQRGPKERWQDAVKKAKEVQRLSMMVERATQIRKSVNQLSLKQKSERRSVKRTTEAGRKSEKQTRKSTGRRSSAPRHLSGLSLRQVSQKFEESGPAIEMRQSEKP